MQATERNIPMKNAIELAEQEIAEIHSRLVHLASILHPVLTPENMNSGAVPDPMPPTKEESPLVMSVRNLGACSKAANRTIEELIRRIEV